MYGALRAPTSNCVVLLAQGALLYRKENYHFVPGGDNGGEVIFTDDSGGRTEE
jgi:hypothetical protein